MTNKDSDKRLDKLFGIDYSDPNLPSIGITPKVSELKSFLHQELDRAREEIIEEVIDILKVDSRESLYVNIPRNAIMPFHEYLADRIEKIYTLNK